MTEPLRYLVFRVPGSGLPNDFATEAEAEARISEIERDHRVSHHTYPTVVSYSGPRAEALAAQGILL